jgi:putative transposase
MARPLRLEFAGALYHVTARGNERRSIFLGDADTDRTAFLDVLASSCERFNWILPAYCLMTNHYHLLVETPDANLSKGMRRLNGVFTQEWTGSGLPLHMRRCWSMFFLITYMSKLLSGATTA